jgi:hypothetical protein
MLLPFRLSLPLARQNGRAASESPYAEPRTPGEVTAQRFGLRTMKAETFEEKQKRLGPVIGARAKVVGAFVRRLQAEAARSGNPYAASAARITDPAELRRKLANRHPITEKAKERLDRVRQDR